MQIQPGESQIVWKAVLCCKVKSEIQQISKSSARFKSKKYKSVIELTWLQRDYWYYVVERQFDRKKILFVMPDERTDRLIYQSIGKTASRKNNEWVERIRCAYRRNAKIMSLWGWWWRYSISGLDDIFGWHWKIGLWSATCVTAERFGWTVEPTFNIGILMLNGNVGRPMIPLRYM